MSAKVAAWTLRRPRFGKDAQKILRVESIANRVGTSTERGLEARDRIAAAFGVRIVGGEQVQVGVGLIDQGANLLEHKRRERHLLRQLLRRLAREAGKVGVGPAPKLRHPVQ